MNNPGISISQRREQINQRLNEARLELNALQEECTHPLLTGTFKSDTGNWSRSDDVYWVEFVCPDCGKRWDEDQISVSWDREYGNRSKSGFPFKKI